MEPTSPSHPTSPKRHFGLLTLLLVALSSAGIATSGTLFLPRLWEPADAAHTHAEKEMYQCPMHPSVVQDHPGECPICGMKLVKVEKKEPDKPGAASAGERKILFYRSPMDPKQTSPVPRKDEMGMDYLPVYDDDSQRASSDVPGLGVVDIDPERQQLIGLRTAEVTRGPIGGSWRTVGRVAVDETRVRRVNVKVRGYVEHVFVDFVGKAVKKGDPLFSMFSPDLVAAQEEYLVALKSKATLAAMSGVSETSADALVDAARRKLRLWDVPDSQIERLKKSGKSTRTLTVYSPISGVVTKKDVVFGMTLDAGAMPYEIIDLSTVWVLADVYESDLRFVKEKMGAKLRLNALPDRELSGEVLFIDPIMDPATRTVKVRLTFPNPTGELRPEMFGEVVLSRDPHDALRIPLDAIVDSGTEKVVFVASGDGKLTPRKVEIGETGDMLAEVTQGLSQGEHVVTRANFLIDSESRLRASLQEMTQSTAPKPESARVLPGASAP